jgi:hypothetical protein
MATKNADLVVFRMMLLGKKTGHCIYFYEVSLSLLPGVCICKVLILAKTYILLKVYEHIKIAMFLVI